MVGAGGGIDEIQAARDGSAKVCLDWLAHIPAPTPCRWVAFNDYIADGR
jgi:hypothetical protein